ncbi:hypothetical protein BURPS1710b_3075 [Burkholderia pseudomallei 1710b]|uniref:Uncharacterized protein n=1 Tax=Burkholderia pseudomallei (strain 1710b) TaxID=320372 RepID=Q3JPQ6_BURP1|nr:hypothetical protein BURPS1710b_3075 [Burkholderia pseudomallei 1710b]
MNPRRRACRTRAGPLRRKPQHAASVVGSSYRLRLRLRAEARVCARAARRARGRGVRARRIARIRERHRATEGVRREGARGEGRVHPADRQGAAEGGERRGADRQAHRQLERQLRVLAAGQVHLDVSEAVPAGTAGRRRQALRVRQGSEPGHRAQARGRARREPRRDPVRQQRSRQELHAARRGREGRDRLARNGAEGAGHAVPADRHRLPERHARRDGAARRVRQRDAAHVHEHSDESAAQGRSVQVRRAEGRRRRHRLSGRLPRPTNGPASDGGPVRFGAPLRGPAPPRGARRGIGRRGCHNVRSGGECAPPPFFVGAKVHVRPVCSRTAPAARRGAAPEDARRRDRADASSRRRQAAQARVRIGQAAFDDPLGAARRRQDDARAPDRARIRLRVHRALGGAGRREGHPRGDGAGARHAEPHRPPHDPVRRRNPSLQQGAAGRAAAVRRIGARHVHRRDDREPELRGEFGAAVARAGVRAEVARGRRTAPVAQARAGRGARRARVRRQGGRHARRLRGRRRAALPEPARAGADGGFVRGRDDDRRGVRRERDDDERAPLRQGRRQLLRPDLRAAQVGARLEPGRRAVLAVPDARRRRGPEIPRAARRAHGVGGHRPGRSARDADRERCGADLRTARLAGGRARARAGGALSRVRGEEQRRLQRVQRGDGVRAAGQVARGAGAFAQRADEADEGARLRPRVPLRARRAERLCGGRDVLAGRHARAALVQAGAARARDEDRRQACVAARARPRRGQERLAAPTRVAAVAVRRFSACAPASSSSSRTAPDGSRCRARRRARAGSTARRRSRGCRSRGRPPRRRNAAARPPGDCRSALPDFR